MNEANYASNWEHFGRIDEAQIVEILIAPPRAD
jgi:hypothetical protein